MLPVPKTADLKKFKSFILEKALTCVHKPAGMLKRRFVTPTYGIEPGKDDFADRAERSTTGHYLQMYDWDACLFSQAQSYLGLTDLAKDIVANFLSLEQADGYVPRTISPQKIWDGADLCKPLLAQALQKEQESFDRVPVGAESLESLDHYLGYFDRNRLHTASGLYHWRNMLESGVDDSLALIYPVESSKDENQEVHSYPDGRLLTVDLNSWLVAEYIALSELAKKAGRDDLGKKYGQRSQELAKKIEDKFWVEELSIYCNFDPLTAKHVRIRTWTGLTPVAFGFAREERARQVIEKCIMSASRFLRPAGLATVAASETCYNQAERGLYGRAIVSNWQGPVWVVPNVLVVRGMLHYGYKKEAQELALATVATLVNDFNKTGTIHENYNAETGEALWAPNFMSWNVLSLELMELLA